MAKQNEPLDRYLREKLENHQEKPSMLAWERLESQLPPSKSSPKISWWTMAATVSVILVAGWLFWNNSLELAQENLVAEEKSSLVKPLPSSESQTLEAEEILPQAEEKPLEELNPTKTNLPQVQLANSSQKVIELTNAHQKSFPEQAQNLIASQEIQSVDLPAKMPTNPALENQVTLPQIQTIQVQNAVAEASPGEEEVFTYRVNIYSNGLKKGQEPEKNLITEMGKTVGKVEGLLGKVDDGFIELQDKKNSLFASLTSKKQADE